MKTVCYFPSLSGKAFVKENLISELKRITPATNKDSFVAGVYEGVPVFADKVEIEDIDFVELV